MGELRAVRVSHELWKQIMTQDYTGIFRCIKGLPEDARLVSVLWCETSPSGPDPVFVFGSDNWQDDPGERVVEGFNQTWPEFVPEFRTAECRTCKYLDESKTPIDPDWCHQIGMPVDLDFGCTFYNSEQVDA